MVFEHFASFIVDKFLGNYLEDFDCDQLKIDLWNGNITLKNIHLKKNSLNHFNLPFQIETGYLEKCQIHIPWTHLYTQPTKIQIEGFYLLLSPSTDINFDPEEYEKEEYQSKMKQINKIEQFRHSREQYQQHGKSVNNKDSFFERLQFHILRNIEIEIENIHIAYDDKTTKSYPFQFGITLYSIKLYKTNNQWDDIKSEEDEKLISKFGEINDLSIYWNSNIKSRLDLSKEDMIDDLKSSNHLKFDKINYILQPLNVQAKLEIGKRGQEQDFHQPVLNAQIDFQDIYLNINRNQYSDFLDLLEFQDYLNTKSKFIKYYTIVDQIKDQKQTLKRWKFAYTAILNEYVRPRLSSFKWENIKENLSRYKEYHLIYLKELNHHSNKQEKQRARELEKQIDVFNLIYLRRTAQIEHQKKKIEDKAMSWWEKLTNWWNPDDSEDNTEFRLNDSLSNEEKDKFYQGIGYKENQSSDDLSYPEEYIDINLSIGFNLIQINVWSLINQNDSNLKLISTLEIVNSQLKFSRRPLRDDFILIIDLKSFQMFGIDDQSNEFSRSILIQSFIKSEENIFHLEFETNPLNSISDYRIQGISQPLQINYHAITINKLIQCFLPDRHHDLQGIKEAAYSIYTDIKQQTQFLLNENLKKIKDLDININLKSIYFILPEYQSSAVICADFGHLTFKGGNKNISNLQQDVFYDAKNQFYEQNESSFVPIEIILENIQLLYLNQQEFWKDFILKEDSSSHLIKPITLTLNLFKSIFIDDTNIPIWKSNAEICLIECRISDTRLFGFLKLLKTIPYPQSNENEDKQKSLKDDVKHNPSTQETYETIEQMTPVKKILYQQEQDLQKTIEINQSNCQQQITQLTFNFIISKINILFQRALVDLTDYTEEFLRIEFLRIELESTIKTYDIQLKGYLQDLIISHEQFLTKDKKKLILFSRQNNSKLFSINCLLTSPTNPLFSNLPYNSIENNIQLKLNQFLIQIHLQALTSIILFTNNIKQKLSQIQKQQQQIKSDYSKTETKSSSSFKIEFDIEQINVLIGNEYSQIIYFQLKHFQGYLSKTNLQLLSHLILKDFSLIDLYKKSPFQFLISKFNQTNDLITLDLALFHSNQQIKTKSKQLNSFIKGNIEKFNFIFLSKHLQLILSLINSFQTKQDKDEQQEETSSNFLCSTFENYQQNSIEFIMDFVLNGPQIIIPINSYSNNGILIDLGKLIMHTDSNNQINSSSIEQHRITWEKISSNRINFDHQNQIVNQVILLESSPFIALINRTLNNDHQTDQNQISIKIIWDNIQLKFGKDDYTFINQIFKLNFNENIFYRTNQIENIQQNHVQSEQIKSSPNISKKENKKNSTKIQFNFQIKQIGLTLYLSQTNLQNNQIIRDENYKFIYLTIQLIEANFQQLTDSTINGKLQIQHLLLDDLRKINISRLIDKQFHVKQNTPILNVNLIFKQSIRTVNGQLESFYICISPDLLNSIKQFISYQISSAEKNRPHPSISNDLPLDIPSPAKSISQYQQPKQIHKSDSQITTNDQSSPKRSVSSDVETNVEIVVNPCHIILLEDQNNKNCNCLVLNFSFSMDMVNTGDDTKMSSSIKDLSFYGTNFEELKDSKMKYSVLLPSQIDAMIMMNSEEQKIDLNIGDLSINIDPTLIKTFVNLNSSINKEEIKPKEEKDKINSKTIFDPKPFKDSSFWFIQDLEEKQELIEEIDILELATGSPSQKTNEIKEKEKEKNVEKKRNLSQQLIVNLKIIEVKLELGKVSSTRPVVALCLSNIFGDIQNWSTDIIISSSIQVELAFFNDNLLSWEPLIEPIIDDQGIIQSPWTITCETRQDQQDENDEQCRYLLDDDNDNKSISKEKKVSGMNLDVKKLICIRGEDLLNLTLTKTSVDLSQRLSSMFNSAYLKGLPSDSDEDQSMLTIHNQTGYNIILDQFIGVEFPNDKLLKEKEINLKVNEFIRLTIPEERLSATHLPSISEQVEKRKQQFSVEIENEKVVVDINQTWKRVYEFFPSSIDSWPIEILCDSQIFEERRKIILSSIIKISNRTLMPLILLDGNSIETKQFNPGTIIDIDQEYSLPIQLIYSRTSSRLYFSFQQDQSNEEIHDFISFDWINESSSDRIFKLNDGRIAHYVIYKEEIEAYSSNTDEPIKKTFHIFVKLSLHLLNLLPIQIQCSIDNIENVCLNPSELYHSIQGNKKSLLRFTIPSYNNASWISEQIDLNLQGHGIHNEHIIIFNQKIRGETLRMILRVETYRQSYRASFYSPFWIINSTDLKFQFKIENEKTFIDNITEPFFVCPKNFQSESHKKKGHIRLFCLEEDENISEWSQGFSVDVIKSTGITQCKVNNDRDYLVSIDIVTCSFGMTKIVTLFPSTAIINHSASNIEITESDLEEDEQNWKLVQSNEIISYWPRLLKEGVMCVRYHKTNGKSTYFSTKDKHRTLLRMDDQQRPALHVEVILTDFNGYTITFGDYQNGDAPLLIVNTLINQTISFYQKDQNQKEMLSPQHYVYYTWMDPLKPQELIISSNQQTTTIQLYPICGILDDSNGSDIYYAIFHDGLQTVLIFSSDRSIIESVSDIGSLNEKMKECIELSLHSIGISIIDDIHRQDLFYITINQSKEIWTERRKFQLKSVSSNLNNKLEENYKIFLKEQDNSTDKQIETKYEIDKNRSVQFNDNIAKISDNQDNYVHVKRQCLDGLWIGYAWSLSNMAIHLRINHLQIDNQLSITLFPTILYPIISKSSGTDLPGKSFIELSILKSESIRSNTIDIKYFKLLIQEFSCCIDQGLIVAIMLFIKADKNLAAPSVDMSTDLKHIDNPLEILLNQVTDNTSKETKIYFDNLHLSPLKIHVSFSMHGAKASEQLLAEHPLLDFLLEILNIAEVQDVILKLNYYERKNDRYSISKLIEEISKHYSNQLLKQIHVVVLGLDVLGNPFGVIRGVKGGVQSFFYEPYKGAMEGPIEFFEGIATGTKYFVGSIIGGAAGAISKVTQATSKGLATLTLDQDYQNTRIQRKEIQAQTTPELISSGQNALQDIKLGVKGIVKKPLKGAKQKGAKGFMKGLGKGFLGLVGRPASGVADLTSTSFKLIKKVATHEEVIHRIRNPRHIGRDGIVRPSISHETLGNFIFNNFDKSIHEQNEGYIAHIESSKHPSILLFATTKRIVYLIETNPLSEVYQVEWEYHYKDIKQIPIVKFNPNCIQFYLKETNSIGMTKKDVLHVKVVPCENIGAARYIVDKIIETINALEH